MRFSSVLPCKNATQKRGLLYFAYLWLLNEGFLRFTTTSRLFIVTRPDFEKPVDWNKNADFSRASFEAWLLLTGNERVKGCQLTVLHELLVISVINVPGLRSSREGDQSSSLRRKVSPPETVEIVQPQEINEKLYDLRKPCACIWLVSLGSKTFWCDLKITTYAIFSDHLDVYALL